MTEGFCNYDSMAGCDDGSCENESCFGCMDTTACNFSENVITDDGSCDFSCYGCIDVAACNYDETQTLDDGSCVYPGCNDDEAVNFDEAAGCDDGSCVYAGCTVDLACNYNPVATIDDGSCEFGTCPGCNDSEATNYNPTSTNADNCLYCNPTAQVEVTAFLSAGQSQSSIFESLSALSGCTVNLTYSGSGSSYPADMLVELVANGESCVVWGGWNISSSGFANSCTDIGTGTGGPWPASWNSSASGDYTASISFTSSPIGVDGACNEYELIITNGWSSGPTVGYELVFYFD